MDLTDPVTIARRPADLIDADLAEVDAAIALVAGGAAGVSRLVGLRRARDRRPDGSRARPGRRPSPSGSTAPTGAAALIFGPTTDRRMAIPKNRPTAGGSARARRPAAVALFPDRRARCRRRQARRDRPDRRPRPGPRTAPPDGLRSPARQCRGSRRAPDQGQGPGRLLERQPLVGRLRDRGDPVHPARRRVGDLRARRCRSRCSSWPCSAIIVVSYRQTIRAYPNGGGSYIVARENLGVGAGLVAAAALLTDYVLTVSVSVAAGIAAITSAFPGRSTACVSRLAARRDRGRDAHQPARRPRERHDLRHPDLRVRRLDARAHRRSASSRRSLGGPPQVTGVTPLVVPAEALGALLLMRAFADGCSAITGVEAVSNGVPAFRPPEARNARTTLTVMAVLVGVMFLGTSYLALVAGAQPAQGETILSELGRAVFGLGPVYYILQFSTMGILILAANTAFADFPRLSSLLARDGFMPSRFAFRGERLAFSTGIVALATPVDRRPRRLRRPRRGAHPALRDRRLHLDHALAGRHGPPLVARPRDRAGGGASSSTGSARSRPGSSP